MAKTAYAALGMGPHRVRPLLHGKLRSSSTNSNIAISSSRRRQTKCCACTSSSWTFPDTMRVLHDKTASAVPVGGFYHGVYHTVVVAPATSNTVAKCVLGHFRHARHQCLCAGRQMPRAGHRLCLRHRARTRNHGAARPGQGLSAQDRPREHRAAEELRADQGGRVARRPGDRRSASGEPNLASHG